MPHKTIYIYIIYYIYIYVPCMRCLAPGALMVSGVVTCFRPDSARDPQYRLGHVHEIS